jgi:hypothetical protein
MVKSRMEINLQLKIRQAQTTQSAAQELGACMKYDRNCPAGSCQEGSNGIAWILL